MTTAWEKKVSSGKGKQRVYSESDCEEMTFIFLFYPTVSLVEIARQYNVLRKNKDGSPNPSDPNNSYVREIVHKFLRRHKSKMWFHLDSIEAEKDRTTPFREVLADRIVAFFPDTERYKELVKIAMEFKLKRLKYDRSRSFEVNFIRNADLTQTIEQLEMCNEGLSDHDVLNM